MRDAVDAPNGPVRVSASCIPSNYCCPHHHHSHHAPHITGSLVQNDTPDEYISRNHYPRAFNSIKSRTLLCTCINTRSRHHSHIFSDAPAGTLCAPEMEARDACICSLLMLVCMYMCIITAPAVAPSLRRPSASRFKFFSPPSSLPLFFTLHHITFT